MPVQIDPRIAQAPEEIPGPCDPTTVEAAGFGKPQRFRNILVIPQRGDRHCGGPIWPRFYFRTTARTCWGPIPIPIDTRPSLRGFPQRVVDSGFWCGLVGYHYGHMITDFGMRIVQSAAAHPSLPLIFALPEGRGFVTPNYFWQMIDALKVDRARIVLVKEPTLVGTLFVYPQAERLYGGGPSTRHLDLMDRRLGDRRAIEKDIDCAFVSRARVDRGGQIAGESYLDEVLARRGIHIYHPEEHSVADQLAFYARAKRLIFSEGSALHTLQLAGRLGADVSILVRRPWRSFGRFLIRPRARSLTYLRAVDALVHGIGRGRRTERHRGVSVLDETRLLQAFERIGIDLSDLWHGPTFRARRDEDIRRWIAYRRSTVRPAKESDFVDRQLAALKIGIRYEG